MLFRDRVDAGRKLAANLDAYADRQDVIVLALPRGGVPVAWEVAQALHAPLDIFLVRKLGVPGHSELAIGAIASGGTHVVNQAVVEQLNITHEQLSEVAAEELIELARREKAYRDNRPAPQLRDQTVILVDDGLATGSTMLAAVKAVQEQHPARVVVAVPVAAVETCEKFQQQVDEVICVQTPQPFYAVGSWYDNFSQTSDDEVRNLLATANEQRTLR